MSVNFLRGYHLKALLSVTHKEHLANDEICRHEVANLSKSGEQILHREPHLLKNCNMLNVDFLNLKSVGVP
jgi:hypothetical protein